MAAPRPDDVDIESHAATHPTHLFVLCHGLHGTTKDMDYLSARLGAKLGRTARVLVPDVNCSQWFATHDGVDTGGRRLADAVQAEMQQLPHLQRISVLGHSLGGLYARFMVGELDERGVFDVVTPAHFMTLASPHLGARQHVKRWGQFVTELFASKALGQTGMQLMLLDGKDDEMPLLRRMATPGSSFFTALGKFERLTLYSNINGDMQVPFCTAALYLRSPYHDVDLSALPRLPAHPSIVDLQAHDVSAVEDVASTIHIHAQDGDQHAQHVLAMHAGLNSLPWQHQHVVGRPLLAHTDICVVSKLLNASVGDSIVEHIVHQLAE